MKCVYSRLRFAVSLLANYKRCSSIKDGTCESNNKVAELNSIQESMRTSSGSVLTAFFNDTKFSFTGLDEFYNGKWPE